MELPGEAKKTILHGWHTAAGASMHAFGGYDMPIQYGSIFPIAPAVGLFTPAAESIDHIAARPADPAPGATIEYGRYLSAICSECHGGELSGKLVDWKQEDFNKAVRTGILPNGRRLPSAMSPKTFGELNDTELAALWLYLQSLSTTKQ